MLPITTPDVYLVVSTPSVGCLTTTGAQAQDMKAVPFGEATVAEINSLVGGVGYSERPPPPQNE